MVVSRKRCDSKALKSMTYSIYMTAKNNCKAAYAHSENTFHYVITNEIVWGATSHRSVRKYKDDVVGHVNTQTALTFPDKSAPSDACKNRENKNKCIISMMGLSHMRALHGAFFFEKLIIVVGTGTGTAVGNNPLVVWHVYGVRTRIHGEHAMVAEVVPGAPSSSPSLWQHTGLYKSL